MSHLPNWRSQVICPHAPIPRYTQPCVCLNGGALPTVSCTSLSCRAMTTWKCRKVRPFRDCPGAPRFPRTWRGARSRGEIPPPKPFSNGCGRVAVHDAQGRTPSVSRTALRGNSTGAYRQKRIGDAVYTSPGMFPSNANRLDLTKTVSVVGEQLYGNRC